MSIRLSKLLSERGFCSRREADRYIEKGQVMVDGIIVNILGTKVSPTAKIQLLRQKKTVTIALYKPLGYVSCQPEPGQKSAYSLLIGLKPQEKVKLGLCGRLDVNSSGLLIFTQDGTLAKKIIGENTDIEKEYLVRLEGDLSEKTLKLLSFGLALDDKPLKRAKVEKMGPGFIKMILREGRYRQIRRMCDLLHLHVRAIKRVRIGKYRLGDLEKGCWKYL